MFDVKIADIGMRLEFSDTDFFSRRLAEYMYSGPALGEHMNMRIRMVDNPAPPECEITGKSGNSTMFTLADGRRGYGVFFETAQKWACVQIFTPDYSEVEILMNSSRKHSVFSNTDFEYMYSGSMFANRLVTLGGVVLHSSALAYKGQTIAFSANCGTGKSTQTGLWKQHFGDDVVIINDDKPAIRFDSGVPVVYGTPWSGKTDLNTQVNAPLKAIIFLEQADKNSIRLLPPSESLFQFTSQIYRPYYDGDVGRKTLDAIEKLVSTTPVYMLSCNVSTEAVMTVYNEIFGKDN